MPGCTSCSQSYSVSTGYIPTTCTNTASCYMDAGCVVYNGPNLTCSAINTNDSLDVILQKIDPLLCATTGDYSTYNTYCLAPINTVQQFVESISGFVCNLNDQVNTFTGTTFPNYQSSTQAQIDGINNQAITCASAGVISSDNLHSLLIKYCTKFTSIDAALDPSAASWNLCYSVSPVPTTVTQGFNVILQQICLLKSLVGTGGSGGTLPVFNNTGSCLASPGSADSLVDTVNKIKTRLCQTGTIDTTTLSWGCIAQPSGAQNLQGAIQNIITVVSNNAKFLPTQYSGDFTITNVDNANLCLGKMVALATPSTQDRFVAATAGDTSPGALQDKLLPGTNITLDYATTPGKVIINSTGGSGGGNGLIYTDNTDATQDYLINKINGGLASMGISLTPVLDTSNPTNHVVSLQLTVNPNTLFTALLNTIATDAAIKTLFCQAITACPSPCLAPLNVQVTYTAGSSTTSTTSTSTTTTTTT